MGMEDWLKPKVVQKEKDPKPYSDEELLKAVDETEEWMRTNNPTGWYQREMTISRNDNIRDAQEQAKKENLKRKRDYPPGLLDRILFLDKIFKHRDDETIASVLQHRAIVDNYHESGEPVASSAQRQHGREVMENMKNPKLLGIRRDTWNNIMNGL